MTPGERFRVETACDGYAALTAADVPDGEDVDAYRAGAARAAEGIRGVLGEVGTGAGEAPELLWHWSPRTNRASIEEHGLTPGNLSNDGDWNPPHICLARDAKTALGLCHGKPPLDLWLVNRDHCVDLIRVDQEWRTTHPVRARQVDVTAHEGSLL